MLAALLGAAMGWACINEPFHCENDQQCVANGVTGQCQGNQYCTFPDEDCASGQRYAESAGGNYLYRQGGAGQFELVSGHKPPALAVANAGWSWGGQFADIDNDGYLDIYALSGYFTAPESVASNLDL